ncbi:MAG: hypothetical protein CMJ80_05885 [Planctomycetaceae bacterium]|nr:hypothetical protein [Planctomycetaceae bacterium]
MAPIAEAAVLERADLLGTPQIVEFLRAGKIECVWGSARRIHPFLDLARFQFAMRGLRVRRRRVATLISGRRLSMFRRGEGVSVRATAVRKDPF